MGFTDEPLNKLWKEKTAEQCPSTIYQIWFLFRGLQFDGKSCMPWLWVLESEILLSILAAPFYIIYKTKKSLGYILFSLIIFTSIIVGYAVLDNQSVVFEPYKIFNKSGIKIGVFGLGIELNGLVDKLMYKETVYNNPVETAEDMVRILKKEQKICFSKNK